MKPKQFLCAILFLTSGVANALVIPFTATLDSQSLRSLSGDTTFAGSFTFAPGALAELTMTSNGDYTATSTYPLDTTKTYYANSIWFSSHSIGPNWLGSDGGTGYIAIFNWGSAVQDSNGAGFFDDSGAASAPTCSGVSLHCYIELGADPGWDLAQLTLYFDSYGYLTSGTLEASEILLTGHAPVVSTYSITPMSWLRASSFDASEIPLPGAVWLFGSGLIAMVGSARRFSRRGSERAGG